MRAGASEGARPAAAAAEVTGAQRGCRPAAESGGASGAGPFLPPAAACQEGAAAALTRRGGDGTRASGCQEALPCPGALRGRARSLAGTGGITGGCILAKSGELPRGG